MISENALRRGGGGGAQRFEVEVAQLVALQPARFRAVSTRRRNTATFQPPPRSYAVSTAATIPRRFDDPPRFEGERRCCSFSVPPSIPLSLPPPSLPSPPPSPPLLSLSSPSLLPLSLTHPPSIRPPPSLSRSRSPALSLSAPLRPTEAGYSPSGLPDEAHSPRTCYGDLAREGLAYCALHDKATAPSMGSRSSFNRE